MTPLTLQDLLDQLEKIDLVPVQPADKEFVKSSNTKLELLISSYLDSLSANPRNLTLDQANILKTLFELTR